jgi:hypothetical protein
MASLFSKVPPWTRQTKDRYLARKKKAENSLIEIAYCSFLFLIPTNVTDLKGKAWRRQYRLGNQEYN